MGGDRDAEREHQDEIADGLHRGPRGGPLDRCGAVGGCRTVLLPRRMTRARADDDPRRDSNQHQKRERACERADHTEGSAMGGWTVSACRPRRCCNLAWCCFSAAAMGVRIAVVPMAPRVVDDAFVVAGASRTPDTGQLQYRQPALRLQCWTGTPEDRVASSAVGRQVRSGRATVAWRCISATKR